jgi:3-hydroxyisobutyrate dehydrogenase-like beta-hydroxyacid dehydrogenase
MHLAFIGFGEVGQRFAHDLRGRPDLTIAAYDIKVHDPEAVGQLRAIAEAAGVRVADSMAAAIAGADMVVSAVTAMAAKAVAETALGLLGPDQTFLDINSVSPMLKAGVSEAFHAAGRHYVEGAVMAPVAVPGISVPILGGGARAAQVAGWLNPLGFRMTPVSDQVGRAAATKLCRSIMIKGIEALIIETEAAATHWGVTADVFASLAETFPSIDWPNLAAVMSARVRRHGMRRAGEMRECADMLAELGRSSDLARSIADLHERHASAKSDA